MKEQNTIRDINKPYLTLILSTILKLDINTQFSKNEIIAGIFHYGVYSFKINRQGKALLPNPILHWEDIKIKGID